MMDDHSHFGAMFPPETVFQTIGDSTVPWRFSTLDEEYGALRSSTALFDLSGCGLVSVDGPDAEDVVGRLFTREVEFLTPETSSMGLLLDAHGRPIDIVTVFRTESGFLVETSVGRATSTIAHIEREAAGRVAVRDARSTTAMLGFEGPLAWELAEAVIDDPITGLPFQGVRPVTIGGTDALVSRTGFTGEYGFKVMFPSRHAGTVWAKAAAQSVPAGHETLETAMTEFRQPILHRDAGNDELSVIGIGANWLVDLEKADFLGRDSLLAERDAGADELPVCFVSDSDGLRVGTELGAHGEVLGHVVHVVFSPGLGTQCGIARLHVDVASSGLVFEVLGTSATVSTVSSPILIPASWGQLMSSRSG